VQLTIGDSDTDEVGYLHFLEFLRSYYWAGGLTGFAETHPTYGQKTIALWHTFRKIVAEHPEIFPPKPLPPHYLNAVRESIYKKYSTRERTKMRRQLERHRPE